MNPLVTIMANKRFSLLLLSAFLLGTFFLVFVQYNSEKNVESLLKLNQQLFEELKKSNHLRTIDRDLLGVESRIRAAIATDDTTHLEGVDEKINELLMYLDTIDEANHDAVVKKQLKRLQYLANEKIEISHSLLEMFHKTGSMDDTIFIANPRARRISDEITRNTQLIYKSRQDLMAEMSNKIAQNGERARQYNNFFVALLLISSAGLCWFIVRQFKQQTQLILDLDVSEKKAHDALHIKENFLANMSHEIRTPLNAILGFTNLLQRQNLDGDSLEFTTSIQSAGENLLTIINDILDLSKIEAGMMRIVPKPFSLNGLMHSLETLFSEKVKEKGLTLKSDIDTTIPDTLIGDATRLTQILVNLIGNAIKFSDNGEIKITVTAIKTAGNKINLRFTIEDHGIGIEEEKLVGIFERFRQAEDSITRNYGGTGLGLSIVQNLIHLQNGSIQVKSTIGAGTTFYFEIQYEIASEQLNEDHEFKEVSLKHAINTSLHFLVVDDNVMNQTLMKHLLSKWNASFDILSGGAEALEALRVKKYDLVLMDIQMPGIDGYSATHAIREQLKSDVPVIAMTAHAMAGEREKCISHGMNEYISKPIDEKELFRIISKFVNYDLADSQAKDINANEEAYKYIDLTYIKEISKGALGYEKVVTGQFLQMIPEDITALHKAYSERDLAKINHIAHNMKTTVGIMGLLTQLEHSLDFLENITQTNPETLAQISKIEDVCTKAVQEATHFYNVLNTNV